MNLKSPKHPKSPKSSNIPNTPSSGWLKSRGIPTILVPGIIFAASLGWMGWKQLENYKNNQIIFPKSATVTSVIDGDTLKITPICSTDIPNSPYPSCPSSVSLRLIGINAPDRGDPEWETSREFLSSLLLNKQIWLEYDRYQNDKFGRILAWIWINCESVPVFTPSDYMHLSPNQSRPELTENPQGCKQGKLVQEETIKSGTAKPVIYQGRGKLRYQSRLEM